MKNQPHIRSLAFYFVSFLLVTNLSGQNLLTDMDHDADRRYDRMIILSGGADPSMHSSIKPYWRKDLISVMDSFALVAKTHKDWADVFFIAANNNEFLIHPDSANSVFEVRQGPDDLSPIYCEKYYTSRHPLWKIFYKTPANFYQVDVPDFYLRINPMLHVALGKETNEETTTFINQRGIHIRGGIGKNVFFQTSIYDSQIRYPNYINGYTKELGVIPGVALFKQFKSAFVDFTEGRDFLLANAYVGVNFGKYFGVQLGHNQSFIGEGIRSLLLSDFSTPFFSLKLNTRIWKLHYQNIFAEMEADNFDSVLGSNHPVAKKYMAAHYLDFKPSPFVSLGLFEAVIFNRDNHQFELQYLNPVILYRTIEGAIGSPDNVLLGFNTRVDLWRKVSCYGQVILDDIFISTILDGHLDYWGNKIGYQLGAKYINALNIDHLDVQAEFNSVRPYTYSHYDFTANYSHYKQALAHPLGANFNEVIFSLSYTIQPGLSFISSVYLVQKGEDSDSVSYGGNILASNLNRPSDNGHQIGQGAKADIMVWSSRINYELATGILLEGTFLWRKKDSVIDALDLNTSLFQLGVRYNMAYREDIF